MFVGGAWTHYGFRKTPVGTVSVAQTRDQPLHVVLVNRYTKSRTL